MAMRGNTKMRSFWAVAAVYVLFLILMFFPPSLPSNLVFVPGDAGFQLCIGLLAVLAALISGGGLRDGLALKKPRLSHMSAGIFLWIAAYILMNLVILTVANYFPSAKTAATEMDSNMQSKGLLSAILLSALLPALCEELLFRGFMLTKLSRAFPVVWSAVITAALFAISHQHWERMLPIFLLGFALGLAGGLSRSVFVPVIMHFINNLAVILAAFAPDAADKVNSVLFGYGLPVSLIIAVAAACAGVYLLTARWGHAK